MTKLSWEDIDRITDELVIKIRESNFKPDYLVGITNGGLIPLYFLTKKLGDISEVFTVAATSYDKDRKKDLQILHVPSVDMTGKKVLLVDEITETGDTLNSVKEVLMEKCHPMEIKTVTLGVNIEKTKIYPDFYGVKESGDWVVFPWEKEDFPEYFTEQ